MKKSTSLAHQCCAETIGTFVLVFFGIGSVHAAVLTNAQSGLWQVAVVWGIAVSLAIYATGTVSGTHINPAITVALVAFRGFPARKAPLYVASQLLGAVLAAAVLYALFANVICDFESSRNIVRGRPGSELSAMVYGEYFPNPAVAGAMKWTSSSVSIAQAMLAEGLGTAFLAFFVLAVTDRRNAGGPGARLSPLFIGLTVSIVISVIAPLTQAGLNPARDFGPRLFAYLAGWGSVAIPGPRGGFFTVYIVSPLIGALGGAGVYQYLLSGAVPARQPTNQQIPEHRPRRSPVMKKVHIAFVGGFLGAGKTTLLWESARRLTEQGKRVALITNDQAPDLVDTKLLLRKGMIVREVAGSCFCCNFPGLIDAAEKLRDSAAPDVLIAEPVGSCTDLSATILQPLKDKFKRRFALAPLSVLADPIRLKQVLTDTDNCLHPSTAYIFLKQLEEADLILVNKTDLLEPAEQQELETLVARHLPGANVRCVSALTGAGIDAWLNEVLSTQQSGRHIAEVDYDTYAEGEAALGWLNADIQLYSSGGEVNWTTFCEELLGRLRADFRERKAQVGHLKLLLCTDTGHLTGNLTHTKGDIAIRSGIERSPDRANLVLNARVEMTPEELEAIVRQTLKIASAPNVTVEIRQLRSIRPGRPRPTHRYADVVRP